jgi:hypothetical protein
MAEGRAPQDGSWLTQHKTGNSCVIQDAWFSDLKLRNSEQWLQQAPKQGDKFMAKCTWCNNIFQSYKGIVISHCNSIGHKAEQAKRVSDPWDLF